MQRNRLGADRGQRRRTGGRRLLARVRRRERERHGLARRNRLDPRLEGWGNYTCNNCEQSHLESSTVGGNYQIGNQKLYSVITDSTIEGNLAINSSRAEIVLFFVSGNVVGGNLSFTNNVGPAIIADNTIAGNLSCQNNDAAPLSIGNTAKSTKGQCTA